MFKGFWNVPNVLSLFRLLLVPALIITYFCVPGTNHVVALVIFLVASITDVCDGFIARATNQITPIGTALDPLADKLLKGATLICLCIDGVLPIWLTVLLITIDVCMIIVGVCLFKKQITIPSNIIGKTGTFVMTVGLVMCFLPKTFGSWGLYLLYAGLIVIVVSVIVYVAVNAKNVVNTLKQQKLQKQQKQDNQTESQQNTTKTCKIDD